MVKLKPRCNICNSDMFKLREENGYNIYRCNCSFCSKCNKMTPDIECGFEGHNYRIECKVCRTEKPSIELNKLFRI